MPLVFDPLPDWSDPAVSRGFASQATRRPDAFNRIPTKVAGIPVLAAVPDGNTDSNLVYVIAMDARRERRPYVVFTTWWDGERWQAQNGRYDLAMSDALGVLTERLRWQVSTAPDEHVYVLAADPAGTDR
jgi:hypothetical protein